MGYTLPKPMAKSLLVLLDLQWHDQVIIPSSGNMFFCNHQLLVSYPLLISALSPLLANLPPNC